MLIIKNLNKTFFPGEVNEKKALCNINYHFFKGDFVTIIGGNGAGKSTLLNCIAGVYIPDTGVCSWMMKISQISRNTKGPVKLPGFQDPLKGTAASMTLEENLVMALKRTKTVFAQSYKGKRS